MIISHNYVTPHFSPKKLVFIPYGVILSPFCVPQDTDWYSSLQTLDSIGFLCEGDDKVSNDSR